MPSEDELSNASSRTDSSASFTLNPTARREILGKLRILRKPQTYLEDRFKPGKVIDRPPVMHYGLALSRDELLSCVRRLNIEPEVLTFENAPGILKSKTYDYAASPAYERDTCEALLIYLNEQPEIDDAALFFAFKDCLVPDDKEFVLCLYTNYTRGKEDWSREAKGRLAVERKVAEIIVGREGLDNPRSCYKWYWDASACGFGYYGPWEEFNAWEFERTPEWARYPVKLHTVELGRLTRKIRVL